MLNKQKGNMYSFVTHTWNPISGKCSHDCKYCYMKVRELPPLHLSEKALKDNLGENRVIFVGSSTDMFAYNVKTEWVLKVLAYCLKYPKNKYLFQSKNPQKIFALRNYIQLYSTVGTTIETNREYPEIMGNAPKIKHRVNYMNLLASVRNFTTMVTIEPILDFDLKELVDLIKQCNPSWVNIGADSQGHNLPEPSKSKIIDLFIELRKITKVRMKDNLKRLF